MPRSKRRKSCERFFNQLYTQRVTLEGMILKPNMVLPGFTCPPQEEVKEVAVGEQQYQVRLTDRKQDEVEDVDEVADATVRCSLANRPCRRSGIAFCRWPIRCAGLRPA